MPEEDQEEQVSPPADEEAAPVSSARYLVQESIGHGGMGQVYRAWDQHLGRYVAVKRISEDPGVDAAVRREAGILAALHHPNIVSIFDFAADEQGPFVVMEHVEGRTLEDLVLGQPLEMPNFLELVTQVCRGLSSAHAAGLVHLDLKPGNIMLQLHRDGSFTSKILDFGLARAGNEQGAQEGELFGSPYTVAPEQLTKQPTGDRTDIYALGCVFYFALSGKNAFEAATVDDILQRHLRGDVTPLHLIAPRVPQAVSLTIGKMLAVEPANRPQTVDEVRSLLLQAARAPVPTQAMTPRPTARPAGVATGRGSKSSGGSGAGLIVLALLVLAGADVWWYYGRKPTVGADGGAAPPAPAVAVDGSGGKPTVDPADAAALARQVGQTIVVEGKVVSVVESSLFHARLLKLADVPEGGATLSVREDVMSAEQVQSWVGKRVRATGQFSAAAGMKRVVIGSGSDLTATSP